jgi:hypothetical protein
MVSGFAKVNVNSARVRTTLAAVIEKSTRSRKMND